MMCLLCKISTKMCMYSPKYISYKGHSSSSHHNYKLGTTQMSINTYTESRLDDNENEHYRHMHRQQIILLVGKNSLFNNRTTIDNRTIRY